MIERMRNEQFNLDDGNWALPPNDLRLQARQTARVTTQDQANGVPPSLQTCAQKVRARASETHFRRVLAFAIASLDRPPTQRPHP